MAATALNYARSGYVGRFLHPDLYDKSMDVYLERTMKVPIMGAQYFNEEMATTLTHKLTTWGNALYTPRRSEDTDPLPFEVPAPGYDKTITLYTYRNAVRLTRTMEKIDQSGHIGSIMRGLPDSGKRFLELMMWNVINTGGATAGSDGSNLFAGDHYHEDPSGGTWDNDEIAAALTTTAFNTTRVSMQKRTDEKGEPSGITAKEIWVPYDLEEKVRQISGTDKVPESSLWAINPWQGINFKVIPYLTDTNGWFVWGDLPRDMWGLHLAFLTKPKISRLAYPDATYPDIVAGWYIYIQVAAAGSQLKNLHRNQGA